MKKFLLALALVGCGTKEEAILKSLGSNVVCYGEDPRLCINMSTRMVNLCVFSGTGTSTIANCSPIGVLTPVPVER